MTDADLDRIEQELGLTLPAAYRSEMSPFPVAGEAGQSEGLVWDDADALVALNLRLRDEIAEWPVWLFAIGQSLGEPSGWAIDTRQSDAPVWWLEQMHLGSHSGPGAGTFRQWFDQGAGLNELAMTDGPVLLKYLTMWLGLSVFAVVAMWLWVSMWLK